MIFEVNSAELTSHLNAVSRVLSGKNAMPILDNFLWEVSAESLTVTASDGDTTLITSIKIENVEGQGSLAVPAKTILDPLKEMPQQQLKIEVDDQNLEVFVYFATGKFSFISLNAAEYPKRKELEINAHQLTIAAPALLNGINSCLFATGDDDLRPVMNGVFFDVKEDRITFVASDSKKLVRLINTSVQPGYEASFILPKKPANMIKNIMGKDVAMCDITFDTKSARFTFGSYEINCRLIEGKFPRYEGVIPKNNTNKLTIDRQTFMGVLRRISVFASSATNQVKFDLGNNELTVSAQDIDFSTAATEHVTCSYEDTPMAIGFKANFLIEILNTIQAQEIMLMLSDPARAGLIVPVENNQDEDLLMLIMPMQLSEF